MDELKQKIEALLFSSGKKMTSNEISVLTRAKPEAVQEALKQLQEDYAAKDSSLIIIQEGEYSKITVKERHLDLVRKIVTQPELSKTVMETLATIAWKAPCLQSDIIRIRTNKAYDHIKELEEEGFLLRTKKGRTQHIKLTPRFYDYFDIPHEKVKELFLRFENLEKQIQQKETEILEARENIKKIEEEHRKQKEDMEKIDLKDIDLVDTQQEKMAAELILAEHRKEQRKLSKHPIEIIRDTLGPLEIVDVEPSPEEETEQKNVRELEDVSINDAEERMQRDLPQPLKEKVNQRVKEIVPAATKLIDEEEREKHNESEDTNEEPETSDTSEDESEIKNETEEQPEDRAEKDIEDKIDKRVEELMKPEKKNE